MNTKEIKNCHDNTMTLREPRRKKKVRLRQRDPLPINIGSKNEWTVYTGYLGNLGVCVTEPYEIEALNTMGFFGKGSLSRSFPNFEKTKDDVPPIVRHRQWVRRQAWLEQAEQLDAEAFATLSKDKEWDNGNFHSEDESNQEKETFNEENLCQNVLEGQDIKASTNLQESDEKMNEHLENNESTNELKYNQTKQEAVLNVEAEPNKTYLNSPKTDKENLNRSQNDERFTLASTKVYEVLLNSSEEDEIYEVSNTESAKPMTERVSDNADVILLSDKELSMDLDEADLYETEDKNLDTDDAEMGDKKLLVLPDSDSDTENYLNNIKPTIKKEEFPIRETMYLTFEEAFFLMFGLDCLQIVSFEGDLLNILDAWNYFCRTQNDFVQKYVVYHYFRSKGWVVKPGLKYGGDFLLYKHGPPFYHASYIVIVEVLNADTLLRDEKKTTHKMSWNKLFGLDRLSETAAKEILFAQVLWPSKILQSGEIPTPEMLAEFTVKELLFRRWIPKQKRGETDLENDDE